MAATDLTFGALFRDALINCQQNASDATSSHMHLARRKAIRVMEKLRKELTWFSAPTISSFQTTAGTRDYDLSATLGKNVQRVLDLWYSDDGTTNYTPAGGVEQVRWSELEDIASTDSNNHSHVSAWAWENHKLHIRPKPDGAIYIVVRYVQAPTILGFTFTRGDWAYHKVVGDTITSLTVTEIDATTDPSGWLEHAYDVLLSQTVRDLYLGPYQAKDPKGALSESWIAIRNDAWKELQRERRLSQPPPITTPYMTPGD